MRAYVDVFFMLLPLCLVGLWIFTQRRNPGRSTRFVVKYFNRVCLGLFAAALLTFGVSVLLKQAMIFPAYVYLELATAQLGVILALVHAHADNMRSKARSANTVLK